MSQYYNEDQLSKYLFVDEKLGFQIVKNDSYNEELIEENIKKTKMIEELKCCAIQTAIVGSGKGILGSIKLEGKEVSVRKVFEDAGVKLDLPQTAKISEGDLTPRRIQRFFRYTIADYIQRNKMSSYLYLKYSDHDEKFKFKIFPGSEHLLRDKEECKYLFETYLRLDHQIGTTISERIYRVLLTRGVLSMKEMDDMKKNFIELKKCI